MKRFSRMVYLFLAVLLAAGLIAGCSPAGTTTVATTNSPTTQGTTSATSTNWRVDDKDWEIADWYQENTTEITYDPDVTVCHTILYEKTGLKKVTFISQEIDKLAAMIASNDLPELISIAYGNGKLIDDLISSGSVLPRFDLMDQYAPDFKANVEKYPDLVNWYKYEKDGKLYSLPNFAQQDRKVREKETDTWFTCVARTDLMTQIGVTPADFKTQDGFVAALKKFKDAGIKQDGTDIYPLVGLNDLTTDAFTTLEGFAQMFGIANEDPATGKWVHSLYDPKFKEYMAFMNRLYREGLMTDQNIVMKYEELTQVATTNRIFAYWGYLSIGSTFGDINRNSNGAITFDPVGPVLSNDEKDPAMRVNSIGGGWLGTYMTKNAVEKERITKLLAYLFSEEGQIDMKWGKEGVTYTKIDDITYEYTQAWKDLDSTNVPERSRLYGTESIHFLLDFKYAWSYEFEKFEDKEPWWQMYDLMRHQYNVFGYPGDIYSDVQYKAPAPGTPEQELNTQINLYLDGQCIKLLTAKTEDEFATIYDETVKHAENLGLASIIALKDARFQSMKTKLNVTWAFPGNAK